MKPQRTKVLEYTLFPPSFKHFLKFFFRFRKAIVFFSKRPKCPQGVHTPSYPICWDLISSLTYCVSLPSSRFLRSITNRIRILICSVANKGPCYSWCDLAKDCNLLCPRNDFFFVSSPKLHHYPLTPHTCWQQRPGPPGSGGWLLMPPHTYTRSPPPFTWWQPRQSPSIFHALDNHCVGDILKLCAHTHPPASPFQDKQFETMDYSLEFNQIINNIYSL